MPGPMKPSEVRTRKTEAIPEAVFEVCNRLIAQAWDGRSATFTQRLFRSEVAKTLNVPNVVLAYLDVEESYRAVGWDVEYDKPSYNETHEATLTFKIGKS